MESKTKIYCKKETVKVIHAKIFIYGTKVDSDPLFIRGRVETDDIGVSLYIENETDVSNSIFSLIREACLDAVMSSSMMCPALEARVIPDDRELHIHLKLVEEYVEIKLKNSLL